MFLWKTSWKGFNGNKIWRCTARHEHGKSGQSSSLYGSSYNVMFSPDIWNVPKLFQYTTLCANFGTNRDNVKTEKAFQNLFEVPQKKFLDFFSVRDFAEINNTLTSSAGTSILWIVFYLFPLFSTKTPLQKKLHQYFRSFL